MLRARIGAAEGGEMQTRMIGDALAQLRRERRVRTSPPSTSK